MKELKNLKILYIDDESFIRENAVDYLSLYCDNVYEANNGLDGIEKYEKFKPDIIITDIKMPKLNGLEMIKQIRKNDKKTKIIIATAFIDVDFLLIAVELGLIKYIEKPITQDKLLPALKLCIEDIIEENSIYKIDGNFTFDTFNKTLFNKNKKILLAKKELLVLDLLIKNHKRAVGFSEFDSYIWHGEMSIDAIRTVVRDLRSKISKESIKSISGIGYKIIDNQGI